MASCAFQGTTSTCTYGADGLRRSETVNGVTTYFVYDGQTLIREMHKNVQTNALYNTATYLSGPRGPEYRRDDTATELDSQGRQVSKCRWYVYDGLGSVVGEVDPSGNLTSSPKYDVYGLVRSNAGTASSAMGFVGGLGHLSEAGTGLIYMKARYYDPSLGRFASEDPAQNGLNWFIYCDNNPTNESDPTGKVGRVVDFGIVGVITSILIAAGESFVGTGSLIGQPYSAAIEWIENKIAVMTGETAAEEEVSAIEVTTGEEQKLAGDDAGGDATTLGGGLSAEDAARREVAVIELNQVIDMLIMTDDYAP